MIQPSDDVLLTVAQRALDAWHLQVTQIELISKSENTVFRLQTEANGIYVLRIHRPGYHTLAELNAEQQWTAALHQAGLAVPKPLKTQNGDGYARVPWPESKETRYVGIVEWIEGISLTRLIAQATDVHALIPHFNQLGCIAARIHNQATRWRCPPHFRRHAFDADGLMGDAPFWGRFWMLPQLSETEQQWLLHIRHTIYRLLSDFGKSPDIYSMIHADLHPGNLLVHGEALHVIDFDDAGFGWHLYELAVALFYYQGNPHFEAIQAALIAGYRSERALSDDALALLPLFLLIRALALLGWIQDRPELNNQYRIPGLLARAQEQAAALSLS